MKHIPEEQNKQEMQTHVVIMAGGIGSRFWPVSTPDFPKQFIDVLGVGRSLLRMTVDRLAPICPPENMWIITGEKYVPLVQEQIPEIPASNILAEPAMRNTAPCIAYACWKIRSVAGRSNIIVTPADAFVLDEDEYRRVLLEALSFTEDSDAIVTVGIKPTRPDTGYGYIATSAQSEMSGIRVVRAFKEKPDVDTAKAYLLSGNYLWNAGIFVWNSDTIFTAISLYAPEIASVMDALKKRSFSEEAVSELFPTCPKISIDYAVMEKSPCIYTIPGDFGWSDLGTWNSLRLNSGRDCDGNALISDSPVTLSDCSGCVVSIRGLEEVVLEGLKDYVVAYKDGRLLVCRLSNEQMIKDLHK